MKRPFGDFKSPFGQLKTPFADFEAPLADFETPFVEMEMASADVKTGLRRLTFGSAETLSTLPQLFTAKIAGGARLSRA